MRSKKSVGRLLLVGTTTLVVGLTVAGYAATRLYPREVLRQVLPQNGATQAFDGWLEPKIQRVAVKDPIARKIVQAAHAQEGDAYNASYRQISYPGGDVPKVAAPAPTSW